MLECIGVESSVCIVVFVVCRGGVLMVVGVGKFVMYNLFFMYFFFVEVCLIGFGDFVLGFF